MSRYYYFDPSAWIKLYFEELGSSVVRELFYRTLKEQRLITPLGYVEAAAALARQRPPIRSEKSLPGGLNVMLDRDWNLFTVLAMDNQVFAEAIAVTRAHRLRGADAIHLASALLVDRLISNRRNRVVMLTADRELLTASVQAGLQAVDPSADDFSPM